MRILVISSAPLVLIEEQWFMYSPYEKEMQLWAKHSTEIQFCCPIWKESKGLLVSKVGFPMERPIELKEFDVKSVVRIFKAISSSIYNLKLLYKSFNQAEHIHLRCPGNIALLACFVQILFPNKKKTAKYAGNWDPKSKQPLSYKLQKWILSNTFLTKNIQVLVYGEWEKRSKNIKPFFTATYTDKEIKETLVRSLEETIQFLFVGMLSKGKQPLYVAKLIKELVNKGHNVQLQYFGDGLLRDEIQDFIENNNLQNRIKLKGNQYKEALETAYQTSHFLVLPSLSEGWPKVVAEAMFWGCVPVVSSVSCVPYMIDNGNRGVLLQEQLEQDVKQIISIIKDHTKYEEMSYNGMNWSRHFTIDKFEDEIKNILSN